MLTLGFLSRLFGKRKVVAAPGLRVKPGTDRVSTPLLCPACKREIARFTPEKGIAVCECGECYAIMSYEIKPLPSGVKLDDAMG